MIRHRQWLGAVAVSVLAACSEPMQPLEDGRSVATTREPTPEELASLPPEFQFPTYIYRHDISGSFQSGFALAQSILEYFASHAKIVLTLDLFSGRTAIGPRSTAIEERGDFLPARRQFSAMITAGLPGACGHYFNATSTASIYNQVPTGPGSTWMWMQKTNTVSNAFAQGACPCDGGGGYTGENGEMATTVTPSSPTFECGTGETTTSGGGGSSGSGGSWATITTTTCHGNHYYDADGNYLHSEITYCEQNTTYAWIPSAA